jgi:hypothetical protein
MVERAPRPVRYRRSLLSTPAEKEYALLVRHVLCIFVLTLTPGCLRAGFTASGSDAADQARRDTSMHDAGPDGPIVDAKSDTLAPADASRVDPAAMVKISASAPLLKTAAPTADSCGRYLIALPPNWMPSTFRIGETIHFAVPCKYDDTGLGGWHLAMATWDMTGPAASWIDGDPGQPGIQQIVSKTDQIAGGQLGNVATSVFTPDGSGQLRGVARRYSSAKKGYESVPFSAPSVATIGATSWLISASGVFDVDDNDGSFRGATEPPRAVLSDGGTLWVYSQTVNAPTSDTRYLTVASTSDLKTATPTQLLATGYRHPHVRKAGGFYHLIAYNEVAEQWQHVAGTSPSSFDFARATNLQLERFRGSLGQWDAKKFVGLGSNQPLVIGVEVDDTKQHLLLFYLAGSFDYPANAPYNAPRGLGALRLPLTL